MIMIPKPYTQVLAAVLVCSVPSAPLAAADCTLTVKSCIPTYQGKIRVKAFDGSDLVHMVPASSSDDLAYGQSGQVSCNYSNCDLIVEFFLRSDGRPDIDWNLNDTCSSWTFHPLQDNDTQNGVLDVEGLQSCE